MAVEAHGSLVAAPYQEVHPAGALTAKGRHQRRDHLPPHPVPLHSRQQVDMQVRGEPLDYLPGSPEGVVDVLQRTLLRRRYRLAKVL